MNLTFITEEFPEELFLVDMRSIPDMGISNFDFLLCTTTGLTYCALQHKLIWTMIVFVSNVVSILIAYSGIFPIQFAANKIQTHMLGIS